MPRAGSWTLALDEPERAKERAESARTLALARSVNLRTERTAAKLRRMTELYRERLEGTRHHDRG